MDLFTVPKDSSIGGPGGPAEYRESDKGRRARTPSLACQFSEVVQNLLLGAHVMSESVVACHQSYNCQLVLSRVEVGCILSVVVTMLL